MAKIKVLGVFPAHLPWVLDAGTVLVSVPLLICAHVLCIATAQGGEWCKKMRTVKTVVHSAEGRCTATTMALTSIKQR